MFFMIKLEDNNSSNWKKFKIDIGSVLFAGVFLTWALAILQNNNEYKPKTLNGEIITEQDTNAKKVSVILDQIITMKENGISDNQIFECVIRDGEITVSDLSLKDYELGVYVVKSKKDNLEYVSISDKELDWIVNNVRAQDMYNKWLNVLLKKDLVKHCSK